MSISLGDFIGMSLRGSPAGLIRRSVRRLEEAGVPILPEHLEAHALAGGNLDRMTEAMLAARAAGNPVEWAHLAALDLTGRDPVQAVRALDADQELVFDCYSPGDSEKIFGYTRDGTRVETAMRVTYRPPLIPNSNRIEHLQERLAVKVAIIINTAAGQSELELRRSECEARLLAIATDTLSSVRRVQIKFRPALEQPPDA